jgi:uncharacterized cupredoxin-like copper-binding protein
MESVLKRIRMSIVLISSLFLAACGASDDKFIEPSGSQLVELGAVVDAVDWSTAEERKLVLDEFSFSPADLVFKINQPYELTLSNEGGFPHNFVASEFFGAIAVKGLVFPDGEVNLPLLESIALEAGETNTLIFVPLEQGSFPLVCDQPLHETFGMEGLIRIE